MKTRNILGTLCLTGLFALASVTTGCKKYEDGPLISLRSKKARVANTWKIDKAYDNGSDVTGEYDQYVLQLNEDGYAKLTAEYDYSGFTFSGSTEGRWSFEGDKENLKMDFENNDADGTYKILRLKEDEMWLEEAGNGRELHLKPN